MAWGEGGLPYWRTWREFWLPTGICCHCLAGNGPHWFLHTSSKDSMWERWGLLTSGGSCRFPLGFLRHHTGREEKGSLEPPSGDRSPGSPLAFSNTIFAEDDGRTVTSEWGWKYRLPSEPLILGREIGLQFFPMCSYFWKFSVFSGCPFLGPLVRESRPFQSFSCCCCLCLLAFPGCRLL